MKQPKNGPKQPPARHVFETARTGPAQRYVPLPRKSKPTPPSKRK